MSEPRTGHYWRRSTILNLAHVFVAGETDGESACGRALLFYTGEMPTGEWVPKCTACVGIAAAMGHAPRGEDRKTGGISAHGAHWGFGARVNARRRADL